MAEVAREHHHAYLRIGVVQIAQEFLSTVFRPVVDIDQFDFALIVTLEYLNQTGVAGEKYLLLVVAGTMTLTIGLCDDMCDLKAFGVKAIKR